MTIKAVLFDIDGTLVDSNDMHVLAWEAAFAEIGMHLDRQMIHDQIGKGADMLVPALLPGVGKATIDKLGDAHGAVFKDRYLGAARPFPGARDLLAQAHGCGQHVVLATSATQDELDHYLDLLDVRGLVSATTCGDDVEHSKPAPDIFATALGKLSGVAADEAIVVGDTPYDIAAARKCGIGTIALLSGKFDGRRLRDAIAIYHDAATLLADYDTSPLARVPMLQA